MAGRRGIGQVLADIIVWPPVSTPAPRVLDIPEENCGPRMLDVLGASHPRLGAQPPRVALLCSRHSRSSRSFSSPRSAA